MIELFDAMADLTRSKQRRAAATSPNECPECKTAGQGYKLCSYHEKEFCPCCGRDYCEVDAVYDTAVDKELGIL
jgi:hypothetical protein